MYLQYQEANKSSSTLDLAKHPLVLLSSNNAVELQNSIAESLLFPLKRKSHLQILGEQRTPILDSEVASLVAVFPDFIYDHYQGLMLRDFADEICALYNVTQPHFDSYPGWAKLSQQLLKNVELKHKLALPYFVLSQKFKILYYFFGNTKFTIDEQTLPALDFLKQQLNEKTSFLMCVRSIEVKKTHPAHHIKVFVGPDSQSLFDEEDDIGEDEYAA